MRSQIISKLIIKDLRDLMKNPSILPIVVLAPFLAFIMTKLTQGPKEQLLPMWIIYALAMVGVMIPGFLTAEEKEKGTLDSLLISPARHEEIIMGKVLFSLMIIIVDVFLVLAPNNGLTGNQVLLWFGVVLASVFFIQIGLIIGLFTNSQVAAGAISSPAMLFFFLTPMFAEVLPKVFQSMIEYLPSSSVTIMMRVSIQAGSFGEVIPSIISLVVWNIIAYVFTLMGIRRQFQ